MGNINSAIHTTKIYINVHNNDNDNNDKNNNDK